MARGRETQERYTAGGEEIREESSWRYPLTIFLITLLLCAVFLYLYVGPGVDELQGATPKPTLSDDRSRIAVGDVVLNVPANHTVYPRDRRPGEREVLPLYAAWPRMEGYTPARRADFTEDRPNSRRIDIVLEEKRVPFNEDERFDVLYLPHATDPAGTPQEHGLTLYTFSGGGPASGYEDRVMFTGEAADGSRAVLFCYEGEADDPVPPECYRTYDLTSEVTVRYRFKTPHLADWRRIDARVHDFVEGLRVEAGS
ncbi:hypothetical protein [Parvularcula dongshanensis]|uniref:Uncharacterized protein n=1 Tax=Parvularcula dongshanensis TaxID=1173995 RepID=A0A840I0B2_9PROT|nr:hypothetical protein [Parvularcula dongshanensis]MBB4657652.1 hypothetical protein [Parvularcula dongshanensis]